MLLPGTIAYTRSNIWNAPMMLIVVIKYMVGAMLGTVIYQSVCALFAPSSLAASYSSGDTPLSAARKMSMLLPMPLHTETMTMQTMTR